MLLLSLFDICFFLQLPVYKDQIVPMIAII